MSILKKYKKKNKCSTQYLDKLWSNLVKLKANNRCEYPSNGVCLCAGHHVLCNFSAHKAPLEFAEWLKEKRGKKWYEQLRKKAKQTSQIKPDKLTIKNELCKKIKELENVKVQFK